MRHRTLRILTVTGAYPAEYRPHWGTFIKSQVDSLIEQGLEVEVIRPRPGWMPWRYATAVAQVFFKTLSGQYDIVHGHYGLWCLVARLQWTTPVVASFLGSDLLGNPTADGRYARKDALVVHFSRWIARCVDAVIVKSPQMRLIVPARNVHVVPNGVDFDLFRHMSRAEARAVLGWKPDGYYVLFGNDPSTPRKGFSLAQSTLERLRARGMPAELVVANGLPQSEVVRRMNASNALLLTSIHEGSPNVVKEAMACNIPVVSTDVGDVAEVIGRTAGCAVCPRDPDALATALDAALRYPGPTTGRLDIRHLDRVIVAHQVIAVYQSVIRRTVSQQAPLSIVEGHHVETAKHPDGDRERRRPA
jgi:glycosyltransferase involved in cell wall biosynthesis